MQSFFELDSHGKPSNYGHVVTEATRPLESEHGTMWPITVSDVFGGRGQDYTVTDESVDKAGGILVICAAVAESEREWVQWLGRTARSDRRGQYAVVLLEGEEPLRSLPGKGGFLARFASGSAQTKQYRPELIRALLDCRDVETKKKLEKDGEDIKSGMRLHELCDRFWSHPSHVFDKEHWPQAKDPMQGRLRAFLERATGGAKDNSPAHVAAAAVELGLADSAEAYIASAVYCK